jgi:integrase
VGNLDFTGGVIWIRDDESDDDGWEVKTANRRRSIELPPALADDLTELADGREPTAFLFAQTRGEHKGLPRDRTWLRTLVKRTCEKAGVRVTCPHGLRGTFASVRRVLAERDAARMGEIDVMRQIGDALGHGDHGKTAAAHYVGAPARVPALRVILGGAQPAANPGSGPDFAHNSTHKTGAGVENQGKEAAKR